MTLVATLHTPHTIWMLADRRLYYGPNKYKDDACKIMDLETISDTALLGYAGLRATTQGTQPSDWMSNVLRGNTGQLEDLLGLLGGAMERQLPSHLIKFPSHIPPTHVVVTPAYIGGKLSVYSLDVNVDRVSKKVSKNFKRHIRIIKPSVTVPHQSFVAGSGATVLLKNLDKLAAIRKLTNLHDQGKISALTVADELAKLNFFVHKNTSDNTVGPRCIVVWRYNKKGVHQGGGSHQHYSNEQRDTDSLIIPTIGNGMDVRAIVGLHMSNIQQWLASNDKAPFTLNQERVDIGLQNLATEPDERLR